MRVSRHTSASGRPARKPLLDRLLTAGVLFLIFFTPVAFGAVHPWAYSLMEGVIFFLVILWAVKLFRYDSPGVPRVRFLVLPLALFLGFVWLQLLPLPPSVLQAISPSTYEVYTHSFEGWPGQPAYADLLERVSDVAVPETSGEWLPLSLAPALTEIDLLKFVAYASFFFLIVCYPFGASRRSGGGGRRSDGSRTSDSTPERSFTRKVLLGAMICGFLVAVVGFVNLFTWNGRVLWVLTPFDLEVGAGATRASAPFVNPDNFANYLSVILPLFVAGAVFPTFLSPREHVRAFRVLCGSAAFITLCSLLLSLSRAGWSGAVLGLGTLLLLVTGRIRHRTSGSDVPRSRLVKRASLAVAAVALVAAIFYVGPQGRQSLDLRLSESLEQRQDLFGRAVIWRDAVGMVRDFPVLGVGLGAWPELFPRYRKPGGDEFYREAHNDYLELLSETGVIGSVLLGWFFWLCGRRIFLTLGLLEPGVAVVVAALVAGLSAMAFHELFDFNLQIPANAILFTLLLALSVRLSFPGASHALSGEPGVASRQARPVVRRALAVALALVAVWLVPVSFGHEMLPYPHNLTLHPPGSVREAVERVKAYPAQSDAHLALFRLLFSAASAAPAAGERSGARSESGLEEQLGELRVALWLEPRNTGARDLYGALLLQQMKIEEGLAEVRRSVRDRPFVRDHFYLGKEFVGRLGPSEGEAVEEGFRDAVGEGIPGALDELGQYYAVTGRHLERAAMYEAAAGNVGNRDLQAKYLLEAARSKANSGDLSGAEEMFHRVAEIHPGDTGAYRELIARVYRVEPDLVGAKEAVRKAVEQGADGFPLYLAVADTARAAGAPEEASAAIEAAGAIVEERGRSFEDYASLVRAAHQIGAGKLAQEFLGEASKMVPSTYRGLYGLAELYEQAGKFDRAAFYYQRATRVDPGSAGAFYRLALMEERNFRFDIADGAYAMALRLDPTNEGIEKQYQAFKSRLAVAGGGKD